MWFVRLQRPAGFLFCDQSFALQRRPWARRRSSPPPSLPLDAPSLSSLSFFPRLCRSSRRRWWRDKLPVLSADVKENYFPMTNIKSPPVLVFPLPVGDWSWSFFLGGGGGIWWMTPVTRCRQEFVSLKQSFLSPKKSRIQASFKVETFPAPCWSRFLFLLQRTKMCRLLF